MGKTREGVEGAGGPVPPGLWPQEGSPISSKTTTPLGPFDGPHTIPGTGDAYLCLGGVFHRKVYRGAWPLGCCDHGMVPTLGRVLYEPGPRLETLQLPRLVCVWPSRALVQGHRGRLWAQAGRHPHHARSGATRGQWWAAGKEAGGQQNVELCGVPPARPVR